MFLISKVALISHGFN